MDPQKIFDSMADEYDLLQDHWYSWLCAKLHGFIFHFLKNYGLLEKEKRVLDAGCGTGFQTFLYRDCGFRVEAFDLSPQLVEEGKKKEAMGVSFGQRNGFFGPSIPHKLNQKTAQKIAQLRRKKHPILWSVSDAAKYAYLEESFDIINCCGSTLSFVDDHQYVLKKFHSTLLSGGFLILEVDEKWNMDLIWPAIDYLTGGKLGYKQQWEDLSSRFSKGHERIDYPFELLDGTTLTMKVHLFDSNILSRELRSIGFEVLEQRSIHCWTNLIPSTILHRSSPPWWVYLLFPLLSGLDHCTDSSIPFRNLGCSQFLLARKR